MLVNLDLIGSDSSELNTLINNYQNFYNDLFIPKNNLYLSRAQMFKLTDSLKKTCDIKYANVKNDYFKNYLNYSIASINTSISRGENYLINTFIKNKPIQYHQKEYMQFFNTYFKGYLIATTTNKTGQTLYNIINSNANYNLLYNLLTQDKILINDSLKELVIIQNIWDFYFTANFKSDNIINILRDINLKSKNKEHKIITDNMLAYLNKMQTGSEANNFSARNKNGKIENLSMYKGRWIYLNFFSTKNIESLKEMPKIAMLEKKYGNKIVFLSICLDDSLINYTNYLKSNPKFDWQIWFNKDNSIIKTAKEIYFVSGTESYFLINNFGFLAQSPALSPSKGIEYKFNIIFKNKRKNTKTGIR